MNSAEARQENGKLRRRLAAARLALLWEQAWPLFWPIPALIAAFVALAVLGVLQALPGWAHLAVLAIFAVALLYFIVRQFRLRLPTAEAARRRLERASGLAHGPLDMLADNIGAGADDPVAQSLWEAYRHRATALLAKLRVPLPGPVLPKHDPLGLRFAALLLLVVALAGGWRDAPARLVRSVQPDMAWLLGAPPTLQVWLTPPDYTREAPTLLQNVPEGETVTVPAGTRLLAELQGGRGAASLDLAGTRQDFQALDAASQRLDTELAASGPLTIRQGWRTAGHWIVSVTPDHAPTIAFAKIPDQDPRGRLRFEVEASDEYGLAKTWIEMRRATVKSDRGKSYQVELPLTGHPRSSKQASWHDLTSNPWAGLKVTLTPHATDDAGLDGAGSPVTITLPEREFHHPVARALIMVRKDLAADPDDRQGTIDTLEELLDEPKAWGEDTLVALAMSEAGSRLTYDRSDEAVDSVIDTLWQTALRLEEGDRPVAERALDEAQQALEKALRDNAPDAEIDRLTAELKAAINRLLQAMVQQALQSGQVLPQPLPGQKVISPEDLDRMLDQMRDMARTGSREAAQQTLDQLRQMLDQLRAGRPMTANRQKMEQSQHANQALQQILKDEEQLLNDTFKRRQDLTQRGHPDSDDAGRQEDIRHKLGDAMQMLGDMGADIPQELGDAEQEMRGASQALGEGDLNESVGAETRAVDKLRQGAEAANQAMQQQMGMGMGLGLTPMPGPGQGDPLGRPLERTDRDGRGNADDEQVKIPAEADLQKAREVLDELRRRSGDAHRPTAERDYLQRLLQRLF